jgi:ribosomal protein S26
MASDKERKKRQDESVSHSDTDNADTKQKEKNRGKNIPIPCFACGIAVPNPKEGNHFGDEVICDSCREDMVSSLEEAWVKHSAFLDSALN